MQQQQTVLITNSMNYNATVTPRNETRKRFQDLRWVAELENSLKPIAFKNLE